MAVYLWYVYFSFPRYSHIAKIITDLKYESNLLRNYTMSLVFKLHWQREFQKSIRTQKLIIHKTKNRKKNDYDSANNFTVSQE